MTCDLPSASDWLKKIPCLFQKFVTRRDLPPAQALPRLSADMEQARSAITMTSTGADPGFFLGGGGVHHKLTDDVKNFKSENEEEGF